MTKELNYVQELRDKKNSQLSITELLGYKTIVICIYRTLDTKLDTFLNKLQGIVQKLTVKIRFCF